MRFDRVNLSKALGKQLLAFLNELFGCLELAASELPNDPSSAAKGDQQLDDDEASRVLRVFIENFEAISRQPGWASDSLLACAIAAESWIEHLGDHEEEVLALLSVRRLLDATAAIVGIEDLSVVSLHVQVKSRLQDLGAAGHTVGVPYSGDLWSDRSVLCSASQTDS